MKIRTIHTIPMQNRPVIDDVAVAFDKRVASPLRAGERMAGRLYLPKLALVRTECED
jgi:hypothetical protein